jgi:hypothetical protein
VFCVFQMELDQSFEISPLEESWEQGAVTKIYAKFTSMPYACKEHIQVYVVAKYEFDEQRKLKIDHIVHV